MDKTNDYFWLIIMVVCSLVQVFDQLSSLAFVLRRLCRGIKAPSWQAEAMTALPAADLSAIAQHEGFVDRLLIIDLDRLTTFTDGDKDLEAELSDLYQITAKRYLKAMEALLREQQDWSAEAHALKGASGNLGASRVAAFAKEAEFEAPSAARLEVLRLAVDDVVAFFAERKG